MPASLAAMDAASLRSVVGAGKRSIVERPPEQVGLIGPGRSADGGSGSTLRDDAHSWPDLCEHVRVLLNLITELQSAEHGQIINRGRIIDHLLDLRLAAAGDLRTTAEIDGLLTDTPGKSTVETAWWQETLVRLRDSASRELTH